MKCYLCGKSNLRIIRKQLRYNIQRNVLKCQNCGLVYLEPKIKNLQEYYDKEYRRLYTPVIGKSLNSQDIFEIYLPYQKGNIDQIKNILNPKMKVLDVGCSTGHFLYSLKKYVGECVGVELNKKYANFAKKKVGIKVFTEPIENIDFSQNYFDLICAFDLIEHLEDPVNFLRTLNKYLKPGGYLYIKTPNLTDSLISIYKLESYCDFWFREPHIYYFSSKTLSQVLKKAGFRGSIKTVQEYNFINQMNWILTGKPQKSADIGMSQPKLVTSDSVDVGIKKDFNCWIQKVNKEYFELLNKHKVGDKLLFIGKKHKSFLF